MPGILSAGMVLCANNEDASVIEFLNPPAGSEPGDVVTIKYKSGDRNLTKDVRLNRK